MKCLPRNLPPVVARVSSSMWRHSKLNSNTKSKCSPRPKCRARLLSFRNTCKLLRMRQTEQQLRKLGWPSFWLPNSPATSWQKKLLCLRRRRSCAGRKSETTIPIVLIFFRTTLVSLPTFDYLKICSFNSFLVPPSVRPYKIFKSSEELALEAALMAQAESRAKIAANKEAFAARMNTRKPKKITLAEAAPKKHAVTKPAQEHHRAPSSMKVLSAAEKEARELAATQQALHKQKFRMQREAYANKVKEARAVEDGNSGRKSSSSGGSATAAGGFKAKKMPDFSKLAQKKQAKSATVPQSPNFSAIRHKATDPANESGHVSREEMNKFYKNMRGETSKALKNAMEQAKGRPRITVAKAPTFATDGTRPHNTVPTYEERTLAEIASHQFKARPLNQAVFNGSGASGIPAVKKHQPTVPQPFAIKGESNPAAKSASGESASSSAGGFKARPVPTSVYSSTIRRASSTRALTVPKSPRMGTKGRSKSLSANENDAGAANTFKAQPIPDYQSLSKQGINTHVKPRGVTVPEQPNLSVGKKYTPAEEAEMPTFKAQPIPDYQTLSAQGINTHVKPRGVTVPEQPNLSVGKKYTPPAEEAEMPTFKAQPIPDYQTLSAQGINTHVKPRGVTVPEQPNLSVGKKYTPAEEAEMPTFKAQPIPDYQTLSTQGINTHVKPRGVTVPESPKISASNRSSGVYEDKNKVELQHQFKARPWDGGSSGAGSAGLGMVTPRPLTVPEPFHLAASTDKKSMWASQQAKAEAEAEAARQFTAQPMPNFNAHAFTPAHSSKVTFYYETIARLTSTTMTARNVTSFGSIDCGNFASYLCLILHSLPWHLHQ